MKRCSIMLIAGETSGDRLAAELIRSIRIQAIQEWALPSPDPQPLRTGLLPYFFGAGGAHMAEAGMSLSVNLTRHSVIGLVEVLKKYRLFKSLFQQLLGEAVARQPEAIIGVDFSGFNRRFAHAIKRRVRARRGAFRNWDPKIIQYVSPQVWASRPGRAKAMERDYDLVLSIFPFEKAWYASHVPGLRVEFVGHPLVDRYHQVRACQPGSSSPRTPSSPPECVVLLPGSRLGEIRRHAPPILACGREMLSRRDVRLRMVLPREDLLGCLEQMQLPDYQYLRKESRRLEVQVGGLPETLNQAALAIASTGTVTMECAYFGVPTVALYKTSWTTYQIAKRIVRVRQLAMPNILAGQTLFPEFIQGQATAGNLARAGLELLENPERRAHIRTSLAKLTQSLGAPGAGLRAAQNILSLLS